jgi:GxxExxY protein
VSNKQIQTAYDELTYKVIGCAMAAHRQLGPGYREDTYQRDLEARLAESGLEYEAQRWLGVYDHQQAGALLGYYIPDFIIAGRVILEIKALRSTDNSHVAQVIGYLAVTGCPLGLLINFGARSLQYRRILPPRNITEHRVNRQWLFVPNWLRNERREG